jgi:hypothetical protein
MLIGLGMGNVMAPATDSIMGSLPRAKAGVGSAMNDTTRQTGGAVGVAVMGSILASRFHSLMSSAPSLRNVPASVAVHARSDIGSALTTAHSPQGAPFSSAIVSAAQHSFVSGFHVAAAMAAGIILCAAVGVLVWLPAREVQVELVPAEASIEVDGAVALEPAMHD